MRWSLKSKIIAWVFIPTAIIMFTVAWVIFSSYQQVTENLIIERNHALTALAAAELSSQLATYTDILIEHTASLTDPGHTLNEAHTDEINQALWEAHGRLELFDGGVLVLNNQGTVVGTDTERLENLGESWSDRAYFRQMLRTPDVIFSDIISDGVNGEPVVAVAAPISGAQGQFLGVLVGFLRLDGALHSSLYREVSNLDSAAQGQLFLIDSNNRLVYHPSIAYTNSVFTEWPVAQQALDGESGATRIRAADGYEMIASFTPVANTPWVVVTEESWDVLIATNQIYAAYLMMLLAISLILPAIIMSIGVRQITKPVQELTTAVSDVAKGNFGQTIQVKTGDEIETLAVQFNHMSRELAESYGRLERRLEEQIKAEEALRSSEVRYRSLFEDAPIPLWEEDFSAIKPHIDQLKADGVTDFQTYFENNLEVVHNYAKLVKVVDVNKATIKYMGGGDKVSFLTTLADLFKTDTYPIFTQELITLAQGRTTATLETHGNFHNEEETYFTLQLSIVPGYEESWGKIFIAITDITHRMKIEAELRAYQADLANLVAARTAALTAANTELAQEIEGRTQTEAALQATLSRTEALYRASRTLTQIESLTQLLQSAVDNVTTTLSADHVVLYLIDYETKEITHVIRGGSENNQTTDITFDELQQALSGWILGGGTVSLSPQDEFNPQESLSAQQSYDETPSGHIIIAPLQYGRHTRGVLTVVNQPEDAHFTQGDAALVTALANQAGVAIENARLYRETVRRAKNLTALYAVGQEIASTLDLSEIMQTIVDNVVKVVHAERSLILLIDAEKEKITDVFSYGLAHGELDEFTFPEVQAGISGWVIRNRQPTLSDNLQIDPRNTDIALASARHHNNRSAIIAPLIIKDKVIGTLTVLNTHGNKPFAAVDLNLVTLFAAQATNAIQNAYLYEAAQEADRLKSAFLASMSHELRTPLNSIIGFTGIILQGLTGPLNEEQDKQLSMVRNSARHLLSLINDVLDISKIEAGQLTVDLAPFDMRRAIMTAIQTVMPLAEKKDLPLLIDITSDVGELISDQRRVEQILINLINNAVKFTNEGEVRVACYTQSDRLIVKVTDSGIGIKDADAHKLFQPFQQIDSGLARLHEGTGLGLSICKRLVDILDGEIWLESEWQVGSVFAFSLPLPDVERV